MALVGPRQVSPALLVGVATTVAVLIVGVVAVLRFVADGGAGTSTSAGAEDPTVIGAAGSGGGDGAGLDPGAGATATLGEVTTSRPGSTSTSPTTTRPTTGPTVSGSTGDPEASGSTTTVATDPSSTETSLTSSSSSSSSTTVASSSTVSTPSSLPTSSSVSTSSTVTTPTTLAELSIEMSRDSCPMLVACTYSFTGQGATPGGELTLRITNEAGVDVATIAGLAYDPRLLADEAGGFASVEFRTTLGRADTHTFTVSDDATGRSAFGAIRFRFLG